LNEQINKNDMDLEPIKNKIYEIRGFRVMLDFDLAEIYEVPTKVLKQAVKRNIRRFPSDFMFELTRQEFTNLRSQIVTSSWGGVRYLPFAFTELGATMLSTVLRSDVSIDASILVIRAFVAVRQLVLNPPADRISELEKRMKELEDYIEGAFTDYNDINEDTRMQLELIDEALAELQARKPTNSPRRRIGYRTNDEDEFI
jgi:DNA recombination-dependent growth factor C